MYAIRASMVYVPTCQKRANFSIFRAKVPKACQSNKGKPIFQLFFVYQCKKSRNILTE